MKPWNTDPFFQYPSHLVSTSEGEVAMPILYYDSSQFMAFFWVDGDRAQKCLSEGLEVVRFGRKALAAVAFYQYRATSIGSYNEVGTAIACVPKGSRVPAMPLLSLFNSLDKGIVGFNVIDLPVTTPAACAAGRDTWGYPKFVTPIDFSLRGRQFHGAVRDPEGSDPICTLAGKTGLGITVPLISLILYSRHQGAMLRTLINIRAKGPICLPGSVRLRVGNSGHRMAVHLQALGLEDARPAFIVHTGGLQLRLNAGAVLP
ncbi:acetoacetate decarboxylase family protein [Rugamonas apoptosis]|uniref:Acetoacetate decarboxylase family protein n=1 Tax=Rugamonas apoptosis TaxID=2758570 RepID=A0A7W2FAX4_9BURK|nr:acetoacetate decarboxylase family protein [Rugamonas apoptosis]MBA5688259.1 acetoacetate decarboxylase family protein [Rugamonas apoptosis]